MKDKKDTDILRDFLIEFCDYIENEVKIRRIATDNALAMQATVADMIRVNEAQKGNDENVA